MAAQLIVLPGTAAVDFEAEADAAWSAIADATDKARAELHPLNPCRERLVNMADACRRAAGGKR